MVLKHNELEKMGITFKPGSYFAALDLSFFHKNEEERSLKLSMELLAKIKVYKQINTFLEKVGSKDTLKLEPLYPVLQFLIDDSFTLEDSQIESFFRLEKHFWELEGHFHDLLLRDIWVFGLTIHAAVLGASLADLNHLEYTGNSDIILSFEEFESVCQDYLGGDLAYDQFIPKAKEVLGKFQEEYQIARRG